MAGREFRDIQDLGHDEPTLLLTNDRHGVPDTTSHTSRVRNVT